MTEKRLTHKQVLNLIIEVYQDYVKLFQNDKIEFRDFAILENVLIKIQEKLKEAKPETNLKEFEVEYDEGIRGFLITNNYYSIALNSERDALTLCNMLNQIVSDVE